MEGGYALGWLVTFRLGQELVRLSELTLNYRYKPVFIQEIILTVTLARHTHIAHNNAG